MKTNPLNRRGFTMVELLVVIVVIGLLAAILLPALSNALRKAKIAVVAMEISNLDSALEAYKNANAGEYPPDCFNYGIAGSSGSPDFKAYANVENHLRRAFPRKTITVANSNWVSGGGLQRSINFNPNKPNPSLGDLDPAEALYFWLSQVFANTSDPLFNGSTTSASPTATTTPTNTGTMKNYFDFDQGRFKDLDFDGWPEYYPKHGSDSPYVYFHNQTYSQFGAGTAVTIANTGIASSFYNAPSTANGVARPYLTLTNGGSTNSFVNPTRFQIIAPGLDSSYCNSGTDTGASGVAKKFFPSATLKITMKMPPITQDDRDNITNFSEGKTLQDNQ